MGQRTLLVELTGARGVGKSTTAGALVRELRDRGLACNEPRPPNRFSATVNRLRALADQARAVWIFGRWRPASVAELDMLVRRYRRLRQAVRAADAAGGIHVLDEGLCQLAMTAYIKTRRKDMVAILDTLTRDIGPPNVVAFITGSEAVLAERRDGRGNAGDRRFPRLRTEGRDALRALWTALESGLAASGGTILIGVDTDERDAATTARVVADTIQANHRSSAPGSTKSLRAESA